jgi:adenosylcobinamide-GDP ribazoletransferase
MPDSLRLAIGTFTRIPVPAPRRVDGGIAGRAMLLGPLIALVLGLLIGIPAQVLVNVGPSPALVAAALAVAALAWLTRALHLDGLADTADALGSGRPPEHALDIARRSDIGPFGVVTLVLVLLLQTSALADLLARGAGGGSFAVALVTGRIAIVLACMRGIPAARPDGLGALVAGSVPRWAGLLVAVGWLAFAAGSVANAHGAVSGAATGAAILVSFGLAGLLVRTARRRLGGITGDVLGAAAEMGATCVLVILVVLPG